MKQRLATIEQSSLEAILTLLQQNRGPDHPDEDLKGLIGLLVEENIEPFDVLARKPGARSFYWRRRDRLAANASRMLPQ